MSKRINVIVHPKSKHPRVEYGPAGFLHLYVSAAAIDGKANEASIAMLAEYFKIPKSLVVLHRGQTGKYKQFFVG